MHMPETPCLEEFPTRLSHLTLASCLLRWVPPAPAQEESSLCVLNTKHPIHSYPPPMFAGLSHSGQRPSSLITPGPGTRQVGGAPQPHSRLQSFKLMNPEAAGPALPGLPMEIMMQSPAHSAHSPSASFLIPGTPSSLCDPRALCPLFLGSLSQKPCF